MDHDLQALRLLYSQGSLFAFCVAIVFLYYFCDNTMYWITKYPTFIPNCKNMSHEEIKAEIQINDSIIDTIVNDLYLPREVENVNKEIDEK